MNNIELEQLKKDMRKYLDFNEEKIQNLHKIPENKLISIKSQIQKFKNIEHSNKREYQRKLAERKIKETIGNRLDGLPIESTPIPESESKKESNPKIEQEKKPVKFKGKKPRILFISDVKGWAWWIKSEYIRKYLSDEFDISIECVVGGGCGYKNINQNKYDFYFTYGYSYIDFLNKVAKNKKATGITAHRPRHVIQPKMGQAGYVHANSMMLLRELHDMGFKDAYYIPNGVDEELFKPINPIRKDGKLIVGHVGKECAAKGQKEFILPAIKKCKVESSTNLRTWKDRLKHTEMPKIYNQMDVFMVASVEDGTPNPALEAAACGRPIISNKIGNMPEFIKDGYNGFIVPRKIEAYVEKINYFKENRDELIRMGKNARKTILEEWTWKKQSENYRNMFKDIFEL